MPDRGKPKTGFPRSLENAGAFPTFPPPDDYDPPSTKGTNLWRESRDNRFFLTDADQLGHNDFTGVASLRAPYRHRPESLSTSRRNGLSASPEYARDHCFPVWKHHRRGITRVALERSRIDAALVPNLGRVKALHLDSDALAAVIETIVALLRPVVRPRAHQVRDAGAKQPQLLELVRGHEAEHQAAHARVRRHNFRKLLSRDVPTSQEIGNGSVGHQDQRLPQEGPSSSRGPASPFMAH